MRNGGAAHKNNEAPRSFDSALRRRQRGVAEKSLWQNAHCLM